MRRHPRLMAIVCTVLTIIVGLTCYYASIRARQRIEMQRASQQMGSEYHKAMQEIMKGGD